MTTFDAGACLLLLAAVIGIVNDRWLGLPNAIALLIGALVAASLLMAADALFIHRHIADYWRDRLVAAQLQHVLLDGVLPLLLFAGTMQVDPRELRDRAVTVLGLATVGVVLATLLFGAGFYALNLLAGAGVPLAWCLVLGAILAPTDAVVVERLLRKVSMPSALRGIITGESLFNDGAAVVVFLAAIAIAEGQPDVIGSGRLLLAMVLEGVGGAVLGWLGGMIAVWVSRGLSDRTLEVTISLALAIAIYRLAVVIEVSGPIAVVAAGLAYRFPPRRLRIQQIARLQVLRSWAVIDDVTNTFLFLLMGFQLLALNTGWAALPLLAASYVVALFARALSVGIPMLPLRMTLRARGRGIVVLTWTGLRGGISVALALTLPPTPYRDLLLTICYGIVVLTIVLQGLLVLPVLRTLYGVSGEKTSES
jgi:CPA1 family monovalent cation:H+ antiporter